MPGTIWAYSRSTGTWVEGLYQNSPQEIDVDAVAFLLDALYDAWPWPAFWIQLNRVRLWSEFRADKLQYFQDHPLTSAYYTWGDNIIHLHSAQFSQDRAGVLAHEVGHMFQDVYRLGDWQDTIGRILWQAHVTMAGTADLEEFAHNVGRILLRRLGKPRELVPKGFENLMEYARQVRS